MDNVAAPKVIPLWSIAVHKESFDLMVASWPELNEGERERLVAAIVKGPPPETLSGLDKDRREPTFDRSIYDRLKRLEEIAKSGLPAAGQTALAELQAKYPYWKAHEGERAHFTMWSESGSGLRDDSKYNTDDLANMSDEERLQVLRDHDRYGSDFLEQWRLLAASRPAQVIQALDTFSRDREPAPGDVWRAAVLGLGEFLSQRNMARPLFDALTREFGRATVDKDVIDAACFALDKVSRQSELPVDEGVFWHVWERALSAALDQRAREPAPETDDWVSQALNQPVGRLTMSAIAVMFRGDYLFNQRFPVETKRRMELLIAGDSAAGREARVLLASRAVFLAAVDPEWFSQNLAGFFDWRRSPEEVVAMWQGFSWGGRISLEAWSILKDQFLDSFSAEHLKLLGNTGDRLSALLIAISLELPADMVPKGQVRNAIRAMTPNGRYEAARFLARRLSPREAGAGGATYADHLWADRIGPFIKDLWPQDRRFVEPGSAKQFALAAIATSERFDDAVGAISRFLMKVEHPGQVIYELGKTDHPDRRSRSSLLLLQQSVDSSSPLLHEELRPILDRIKAAEPDLQHDTAFETLDHALRAAGHQ